MAARSAHAQSDDVDAHAQRLVALLGRVGVDAGVLEPVAEIGVVGIEDDHAAVVERAERARRAAVVLVDLRQAAREVVQLVEHRVDERQLDQRRARAARA